MLRLHVLPLNTLTNTTIAKYAESSFVSPKITPITANLSTMIPVGANSSISSGIISTTTSSLTVLKVGPSSSTAQPIDINQAIEAARVSAGMSTLPNLPIYRSLKDAGEKPKPFAYFLYEDLKFVQCTNGLLSLCPRLGCKNLLAPRNTICRSHVAGIETFNLCRFGTCPVIPNFGL